MPFEAVVAGTKTIEGRLNTGKFAEFVAGDIVNIRKDYRDIHGVRHDGESNAARVQIVTVRKYPDFAAMVEAEYYPAEDQAKYGVLAIEVKVLK